MTILADYEPKEHDLYPNQRYTFPFPAADDESIEVYEIITEGGTDYRYLVPVQDYTLEWNSPYPRYPLKINGQVTFTRNHSAGTTKVVIERNTKIVQLIDFPKYPDFNTRMIEFALDKATMINQELVQRKCDAEVTEDLTQTIVFGSYEDIRANEINFALDKIFDALAEIDASGEDCTEDLEGA